MSNQPILQHPHEALATVCEPFLDSEFDTMEMRELEQDLIDTCKSVGDHGAGLSANQIGVTKRMFVMRQGDRFITCVNPEITKARKSITSRDEGCLSVDSNLRYHVPRWGFIKVRFMNVDGVVFTMKMDKFQALCFQHELDHLNGLMINDFDRRTPEQINTDIKEQGAVALLKEKKKRKKK